MDKKTRRLNDLIGILKQDNGATIRDLSHRMNVSEMTIRRDLEALSDKNIIKLVHGAAIFNPEPSLGAAESDYYHLLTAEDRMKDEKSRIGRKAASVVEQGDVIIIDTGTTTDYLARYLPEDAPFTAICYNMNILMHLRQKKACTLIMAGGYYQENTQMFQSPEGVSLIKNTRANKAFISAAGISDTLGVTCANHYEIETKKAAIDASQTRILMADSSKFGRVKQAYYAELKDFNAVISDTALSGYYRNLIEKMGIELYLV